MAPAFSAPNLERGLGSVHTSWSSPWGEEPHMGTHPHARYLAVNRRTFFRTPNSQEEERQK